MLNPIFTLIIPLAVYFVTVEGFDERQLRHRLKLQLEDYLETEEVSSGLENSLRQIQLPYFFRQGTEPDSIQSYLACFACRAVVSVFNAAARSGLSKEKLTKLIITVCVLLKIEAEHVCRGAVNLNIDTVVYIIRNKPTLTANKMCSMLLSGSGCADPNQDEWSINIPPKIPHNTKVSDGNSLKVLQISDIHYDPEYTPGASAECVEPLCCQVSSTPKNLGSLAGKWGDYRDCDISLEILVDSLEHITAQHKHLDYIYFTGDIINHKIWDTNIEGNKKTISEVLALFRRYFGETPVYPILGNHEPHPVNLFSSEGVNEPSLATQWIFDLSAEEWQYWLPSDTQETILKGGYYSVLPKPGYRVIALNSNLCYFLNFWLWYDDVDPFGQLQWLIDVLGHAEANEETVHILSHVPSGNRACLSNWSKVYNEIVNRFSHIIAAQFTGHTHMDEIVIHFDGENESKPINIAFNGGSLTTYSNLNPNYKIFTVDTETLKVLDFETWTYNVTEANLTPNSSLYWYKLYSFKSAYELADLNPNEIFSLAKRMAKDRALSEKYFRHKHREADTKLVEGCDDECQIKNLCNMVTTNVDNTKHCEMLTELFYLSQPPVY